MNDTTIREEGLRSPSHPSSQVMTMTAPSSDRLLAALAYARRGWPVFPVHTIDALGGCTCGNPGCRDAGKHPRTGHGFKDATTDEDKIGGWWSTWPDANVGIATGSVSGLAIIDIDQPEIPEALLELLGPEAASTPTVRTGGGGLHMYFKHPGDRVPSRTHVMGLAVDVRGDGGYIIAPPSSHESGNAYEWVFDGDPPAMADALRDMLREQEPRVVAAEGNGIDEGSRNDTLTRLAGSMRRAGSSLEGISAALFAENAARCCPPLDPAEIEGIVQSASGWAQGSQSESKTCAVRKHLRGYSVDEMRHMAPESFDWLVEGFLGRGLFTTLSSKPKIGKTTLLCAAISAMAQGTDFLGRKTSSCPVVYLTEEGVPTFWEVLSRTGLQDHKSITIVPGEEAYGLSWEEIIEDVRGLIEPLGKVLLVVDTLTDFVSLPNDWENSSGPVKQVLRPLRAIAREGHAVLGILHQGKGGGSVRDSIRGSSAFAGDPDILTALYERSGFASGRTLEATGRPTGSVWKRQVEFDGQTYHVAGDVDTSKRDEAEQVILDMLPADESDAMMRGDIMSGLTCSAQTRDRVLTKLEKAGLIKGKAAKSAANRPTKAYWRTSAE
jgi:hypothetical protein